ncbi:MAG: NADH dehydrogenase FAD-containing subunit [Nitrospinae bacterium]|nr:NADH dehydrogenase FAD-containing subunit [Nitrospinota bacterium]
MTLTVILAPAIAGLISFFIAADWPRRGLLVAASGAHIVIVAGAWIVAEPAGKYIGLDSIGLFFLTITSALFFAAAIYGVGYLDREDKSHRRDFEEDHHFANQPERWFTGSMLLFLAAMSLVAASQHVGLLWIGVEATTLSSAPMIYFHRHHRSLEAMWKYLLICSVGIALALLGTFFIASASVMADGESASLTLSELAARASGYNPAWLKVAFIFLFVGYGTKMGLAPFHTWLPDAHGESPSVVSALLSGALLNCAFVGILRGYQILLGAGLGDFAREIFTGFGLVSMLVAAIFIINQKDFKRMLAYSSVEHMGIMSLAVGIGGAGAFGAALHAVSHSLVKASLFMLAGNILTVYKTKNVPSVTGAIRALPVSGALWMAGIMAITGAPPFGTFVSEFTILKAALGAEKWIVAAIYLVLLAVIFVGMASAAASMSYGAPSPSGSTAGHAEPKVSYMPPMALLAAALVIGVYIPGPLLAALNNVARTLGGGL